MYTGINLEGINDYSRHFMFADLMKQSRPWGTYGKPYDESAPVDVSGWPTSDAGTYVVTAASAGSKQSQFQIGGRYRVTWDGDGQLEWFSMDAQVENFQYNPKTNSSSADLVVAPNSDLIAIRFRGTTAGVRNVRMWQPGYADAKRTFTDSFLALIAPFSVLRCMDVMGTNGSPVSNWADRTLTTHTTQAKPSGIAYEYLVELANLTKKDIWVNIPHQYTDDFAKQFAKLMADGLDKKLNIYVEHSNETWNWGFPQAGWNRDRASEEQAAGTANYDYDKCNNVYYWAWRRNAEKAVQLQKTFADAFGDASRVRVVLCAQIGWGDGAYQLQQYSDALAYVKAVHGDPKNYFYGIGSGSYTGLSDSDNARVDLDAAGTLQGIITNASWFRPKQELMTKLAKSYGIRNIAYEGGLDITLPQAIADRIRNGTATDADRATLAARQDVHYLTGMQDFLVSLFKDWYNADGDVFCWFNASGQYAQYSWGLVENPSNLDTPKYKAMSLVAAYDASWKPSPAPVPVPATPPASDPPATDPTTPKAPDAYSVVKVTVPVAPCTVNAEDAAFVSGMRLEGNTSDGSKDLGYVSPMAAAGFLVSVPKDGRFRISLSLSGVSDNMQLLVNVGASLLRFASMSSGSWKTYKDVVAGEVDLPAGTLMIQVISLSGGINIRSVTLDVV